MGFHVQNAPKEKVISFFKSHKADFPLFQGGGIKGINVRGIPQFYIFDHRGELVFKGRELPAKKLEEVVNNAPNPLVGEGPYKKLGALVKKIIKHKGLGKIMLQLKEKVETSTDAVEKEEAGDLLRRITGYAQNIKEQAGEIKEQEPLQAYNLYQRLAKEFKGGEFGDEAAQVLDELKKDKEFQKGLRADKKFIELQTLTDKFKPCQSNKPLDIKGCQKCQKKNQKLLNQVTVYGKRLIKQYPEAPAAKKVKELFDEWGIRIK